MVTSSSIAANNSPSAFTLIEEVADFCFGVCLELAGGAGGLLATAGSGGSTTFAVLSRGGWASGSV